MRMSEDRLPVRVLQRWAQSLLASTDLPLRCLEQLGDGVHLSALVERLAGRSVGKHMYRRRTASAVQVEEHIQYVLEFLSRDGLELNIDSGSIVNGCRDQIAGELLWPLLVHYRIPATDSIQHAPRAVLHWCGDRLQDDGLKDLVDDWRDGKRLGALVNTFDKDKCSDWRSWRSDDAEKNLEKAMMMASAIGIDSYLTLEEMSGEDLDETSMTAYLHQFPRLQHHREQQQLPNTL